MAEVLYSAVLFDVAPETEFPHARYTSALFVYDEVFVNGRLLNRYTSSYGAIYPDMHFRTWYHEQAPLLPAQAFTLALDGQLLHDGWEWLGGGEEADPSGFRGEGRPVRHGVIRLRHRQRPVEVAVHTRIDGSPFMIRWLEVSNHSERPVAISKLSPWSGIAWNHRLNEHLPAGGSSRRVCVSICLQP